METVAALPEPRFVLDHAGKPDIAHDGLSAWRRFVDELGALPNVAVKLSGVGPHWTVDQLRPYAGVLFDAFGADRIMFGSDLAAGGFDVPDVVHRVRDYPADGVRRSLESSLSRFGPDHVDIVLVHDPDDFMDDPIGQAIPALVELRERGVIGASGPG